MEVTKVGLGGGCHWCTEAIFNSLVGVTNVEQGWISSKEFSPYSEAVIVHFDKEHISLHTLIAIHLHTHSCTSTHAMREKYRSAIYIDNESERRCAIECLSILSKDFKEPIITQVLLFNDFKLNKEEYLDYYYKNPNKAFCKNQIDPKLKKLISRFSEKVDHNKLKLK